MSYGLICDAIARNRVRGQVCIAVLSTEHPHRFDIEASIGDLSPDHALDAIAIASARIGALHGVPASRAVPVPADDVARLTDIAERIVDRARKVGWWERIIGKAERFFDAPMTFKVPRETIVRDIVRALAAEQQRPAQKEAA